MIKINLQFVHSILGPLIGTADDDNEVEKYRGLDANDEYLVKDVIKQTIKTKFEEKPERYKRAAKNALAYALLTQDFDFEDVFDSNLIAFLPPSEARDFFLWIWEVLFPEEVLSLSGDINSYQTVWDLNEPIIFSMRD